MDWLVTNLQQGNRKLFREMGLSCSDNLTVFIKGRDYHLLQRLTVRNNRPLEIFHENLTYLGTSSENDLQAVLQRLGKAGAIEILPRENGKRLQILILNLTPLMTRRLNE